MNVPPPRMTHLAVMMSLVLGAGVALPAKAQTEPDCEAHPTAARCGPANATDAGAEASSAGSMTGWLLGGLAAVGVGAAAGGGGSSSAATPPPIAGEGPGSPGTPGDPGESGEPGEPSEPSDPDNPGDPGTPVDPVEPVEPGEPGQPGAGHEGGNFGDGDTLVGAGGDVEWHQDTRTTVSGHAGNTGRLSLFSGDLVIEGSGSLGNDGDITISELASLAVVDDGSFVNRNLFHVDGLLTLRDNAQASSHNYMIARPGSVVAMRDQAHLQNFNQLHFYESTFTLDGRSRYENSSPELMSANTTLHASAVRLTGLATFTNHGNLLIGGTLLGSAHAEEAVFLARPTAMPGHTGTVQMVTNNGYMRTFSTADTIKLVSDTQAAAIVNNALLHSEAGIGNAPRGYAAMSGGGAAAVVYNRGDITVTAYGAIAMSGARGATVINDGTINLGTRDIRSGGMVAMESDGTAILNNRAGGVINIHSNESYAFRVGPGSGGRVINNGQINIYGNFSHVGAGDPGWRPEPGADLAWQPEPMPTPVISGYTVGTNADGSSGQLDLRQGGHLADVRVDAGFTRGTAASQVHLPGVFTGVGSGEENIVSDTVVWQARATRDDQGSVDVVMTRNDYRSLAEAPLQEVAAALEAGYASNALYHSLEVDNTRQFNAALQQLSGQHLAVSGLRVTANGEAFWSSMAQPAAIEGARMLSFGVGTGSRHGVRGTGNGVQMSLPFGAGRQLQLSSGVLASTFSADGGSHRNQSRFAGIGVAQSLGAFTVQHLLGSEWHRVDGRRALQWGGTASTAHSQRSLSRTRASSTLGAAVTMGAWHWQPRLGVNAYQGHEDGFTETGAGLLGLSVDAGGYRDVQWETGTTFSAGVSPRWRVHGDAALMGSMAYRATDRNARLLGAAAQGFRLQTASPAGMDYRLVLGADYRHKRLGIGSSVAAQRRFGLDDVQADLLLRLAL